MDIRGFAPQQFLCPISLELMTDPVILSTGITYDRVGIEKWLNSGHHTCPVTNQVLESKDLVSNVTLHRIINRWCLHNNWLVSPAKFIDRSSPRLVSKLLQNIQDGSCPLQALKELRTLAFQNKANVQEISSIRGLRILNSLLVRQIDGTMKWNFEDAEIYMETFGVLCLVSLDEETKFAITQYKALELAIRYLQEGGMQIKVDFLRLLGRLAREKQFRLRVCAVGDQLVTLLFDLLSWHVSTVLVETTLVTLSELCNDKMFRAAALNSGIAVKLEGLLQSVEGTVCEKALELLQILLSFPESRQKVVNEGGSIFVPALTCAILGVSESVTDRALTTLCTLCSNKSCCHEAVRNGGVAKALLLLQAQCNTSTRRKVMELLQLLSKECKQIPEVYWEASAKLAIDKLETKA